MKLEVGGKIIRLIWLFLIGAALVALATGRWSTAFVALITLALTVLPIRFADRFQIALPTGFLSWIVIFIFSTIFLGEAFDFYERYWWWDIFLHAGSAVSFGLIGFVFVFMLFEGDRYAAPPLAVAFIAFCLAMTIGATWEIFEFAMDQTFGMNMQKSGLTDTMWDLIVDTVGATIGATAGYFFLKGRTFGGLAAQIDDFVHKNRHLFGKFRDRSDKSGAKGAPKTGAGKDEGTGGKNGSDAGQSLPKR